MHHLSESLLYLGDQHVKEASQSVSRTTVVIVGGGRIEWSLDVHGDCMQVKIGQS